jgi:hypothetical protein
MVVVHLTPCDLNIHICKYACPKCALSPKAARFQVRRSRCFANSEDFVWVLIRIQFSNRPVPHPNPNINSTQTKGLKSILCEFED